MALTAGSVTVSGDGTYTGSGLAKAIMDAYIPLVLSRYTIPEQAQVLPGVAQFCGDIANAVSSAVVGHITSFAVVPPGSFADSSGGISGSSTVT